MSKEEKETYNALKKKLEEMQKSKKQEIKKEEELEETEEDEDLDEEVEEKPKEEEKASLNFRDLREEARDEIIYNLLVTILKKLK